MRRNGHERKKGVLLTFLFELRTSPWGRALAYPGEEDTGGKFGSFRVKPVGVQVYEPLEYTKSGRIRAGKLVKTIGENGEKGLRFKFYSNYKGGYQFTFPLCPNSYHLQRYHIQRNHVQSPMKKRFDKIFSPFCDQ